MSWKQHIFKPKWQNKNADIRLESVSSEQHPELIGGLLEIAAEDTDKRVRCAAIKRLHQLENILNLHAGESDKEVRTLLEERIRQLASSSNDSRPPLKFRMQVAETTQDRDLIEHLASHAPESELRRAALARVERQGVLGDCAIQDGDARNRSYAASRIAQHTTLKRVIDALRKKDKALYTDLQARLHQELLARGDAEAVHNEALKICTGLEKQASTTKEKSESEIQHLHDAWQQLSANVDSGMSARYERVCERLAAPAVAATPTAIVEKTEEAPLIKSESTIEPKPAAKENEPVEANAAMARLANEVCLYETENPDNPRAASIQRFSSQLEKIWSQWLCSVFSKNWSNKTRNLKRNWPRVMNCWCHWKVNWSKVNCTRRWRHARDCRYLQKDMVRIAIGKNLTASYPVCRRACGSFVTGTIGQTTRFVNA
jgi:hypothetical protein